MCRWELCSAPQASAFLAFPARGRGESTSTPSARGSLTFRSCPFAFRTQGRQCPPPTPSPTPCIWDPSAQSSQSSPKAAPGPTFACRLPPSGRLHCLFPRFPTLRPPGRSAHYLMQTSCPPRSPSPPPPWDSSLRPGLGGLFI